VKTIKREKKKEKIMALDDIYCVSQAWSSINMVMIAQMWKKPFPDLEDDNMQGSPNKVNKKSKILDMARAKRGF
jgi:hypothetical protein